MKDLRRVGVERRKGIVSGFCHLPYHLSLFTSPPLLQNLMGGSKEGKVTWLSSPTGSAFISFTLSLTLKTRSIRPAANNFFLIYFWNKFLGNVLLHLYFLFIFSHRNPEEVLSSRSYSGIQSCISWCYLKQPIIKFC